MTRSEQETRVELIDPMLVTAGWRDALIEREYAHRAGRVRLLGEQPVRDDPQFADYVLRGEPRGPILATIEAKPESHAAGAGMQQALAYATDLGAPFAFSTNGREIVEQDLRTATTRRLTAFPTPAELLTRWQDGRAWRGVEVTNPYGETVPNPLLQPAFSLPGAPSLRYYQERAVSAVLEEILVGHNRTLLSLATGTGKTFIAFNIVHKLLASGYFKRALFIADRITLRDQAYNEFGGLGDRRGVVVNGEVPLQRDVHFAIYQSLYAETASGGRVFEGYPRDYFDLVVIDECHRSGYGDWGAILEHFSGAFHLGMTATPKQDDSIDTYAFFASENLGEDGQPRPIYEYSLGSGIDDGFLATYKVTRVKTSVDEGLVIHDALERGAELIVPEGTTARDTYEMRKFERELVVPDRTRTMCEHLAGFLRTHGALEKTMVFCVTMEHAELVRDEMQRLLGSETGRNLYAARIVSEERDAVPLLEQFQLSDSSEPIVVTTVDLLSTGVNAPSVRNIVFMKPIGSVTMFKQIIGRGSRLDARTNKQFFRIIDYTNATRLFDDWDLPTQPPIQGPLTGALVVAGTVVDAETRDPIAGSAISVRLQGRALAEASTGPNGEFRVEGLPGAVVDVYVTARGYTRRQLRADTTDPGAAELLVELRQPSHADRRIRISGVEVTIAAEVEVELGDGSVLQSSEYLTRARAAVREMVPTNEDLRVTWQSRATRAQLEEFLAGRQITREVLEIVLGRGDVDTFDLLATVAFDAAPMSRDARAAAARPHLMERHPHLPEGFLDSVLDKFRIDGVNEVSTSEVFGVAPFTTKWGGVLGVAQRIGGPENVRALLADIQSTLFATEMDA
ncbi:hypothetical protein CBZ_10600 [Cellulomonas biazotea]|uniref:DEAD/DEAH box helicase n=2 Tax=Cellulomonas biazotea TaxID=1709 RepID=A0A402DPG3_9CELL|nr:hypothetical protein CBZ_10600 [Cellulomonas biazotea]